MKTFLFLAAFIVGALLPGAHADTTLGSPISKLPYTITKPGKYRVIKNLTLTKLPPPGTVGASAAIRVLSSDVTIDLNGFTIAATGDANIVANYGVYVNFKPRVTIRNGTIVGFGEAIRCVGICDTLLAEDLTCDTQIGDAALDLNGRNTVVRRCRIINPSRGISTGTGISAGFSSRIEDCTVSDLHAAGAAPARGFAVDTLGGSDGRNTVLISRCVVSNLMADSGRREGVTSGAMNTVVDAVTFFSLSHPFAVVGSNFQITAKNCIFRSCGSSPLTGSTDGGHNVNVP